MRPITFRTSRESEVVRRRLFTLDATIFSQKLQLEKASAENALLLKANEDLRAENTSLLEIYAQELKRADLLRNLCIDLDEENKELHMSLQVCRFQRSTRAGCNYSSYDSENNK